MFINCVLPVNVIANLFETSFVNNKVMLMETVINYNSISSRLTKLKKGNNAKPASKAVKKYAGGKWIIESKFLTVINRQEDEDAAVRTDVWN